MMIKREIKVKDLFSIALFIVSINSAVYPRDVQVHVKNSTPIELEVRYVMWPVEPAKKKAGTPESINGIKYLKSKEAMDPIMLKGGAAFIHFRIFPRAADEQGKYEEYLEDASDAELKNATDSGAYKLEVFEELLPEEKEKKEKEAIAGGYSIKRAPVKNKKLVC